MRLLLFDLDDTLLRSDKTISAHTLSVLNRCREKSCLIGISTSRSLQNAQAFVGMLSPELIISSGGALVQFQNQILFQAAFSVDEVRRFLRQVEAVVGKCEITIDTLETHYWNKIFDPALAEANWGKSVYSDFSDFSEPALKICVELNDEGEKDRLLAAYGPCDAIRFAGTNWYKFTKQGITKEAAIPMLCQALGITPKDITAFGDDLPDIGMLRTCGTGVAMGNAQAEVKAAASLVIGTNNTEAIADYLEQTFL